MIIRTVLLGYTDACPHYRTDSETSGRVGGQEPDKCRECISGSTKPRNAWPKHTLRRHDKRRRMNNNELLTLARKDLACYAMAIWPKFQLAAHHRLIANHLEAVERGDIRRLMISMPPRHGKSLLTTQIFPAWYLGRRPDRAIISASYGQELADDFGRKVRDFVISPMHRAVFPECCVADAFSMRRFETTAGGSYYAVGRGGADYGPRRGLAADR